MSGVLKSVEIEHRRYKGLVEEAIEQIRDAELVAPGPGGTNSIAVMCWHVAANMRSRFTDFLTTDGEKPWRDREQEFAFRAISRQELLNEWHKCWGVFFDTLATLSEDDLDRQVTVRGRAMPVHEALLRSLTHVSYHTGQVVARARALCGPERWSFLSTPPGRSMIV